MDLSDILTRGFSGSAAALKPLALAGVFAAFLAAERLRALRKRKARLPQRFLVNAVMTALTFGAGFFVVAPVAFTIMARTEGTRVGVVNLFALPSPLRFAAGFLLMDLTFYWWHRVNHRVRLFWRFHNVHHVDPDLDVTTSFRFHFGEIIYSAGFRAVQVALIGVSATTYLIYEFVFQAATMFHHSNMRLPVALERLLNRIIVTPRMHGIHHSVVGPETNSNYSVIFRWWDRLGGSLVLNVPQQKINIGVAGYSEAGDNGLWRLLAMPLVRQKPYWRFPDGKAALREPVATSPRTVLLE